MKDQKRYSMFSGSAPIIMCVRVRVHVSVFVFVCVWVLHACVSTVCVCEMVCVCPGLHTMEHPDLHFVHSVKHISAKNADIVSSLSLRKEEL